MPEKPAIEALQVRRTRWSRLIRLTGEVEAAVECGFFIYVDGQPLAPAGHRLEEAAAPWRRGPVYWSLYDFNLPGSQRELPVRLEMLAPFVEKLGLWVEGTMVYADEDYGRVVTMGAVAPRSHTLPVPAGGPEPRTGSLPVPAADPGAPDTGQVRRE
jgi:hypothetical protein